MEVVEDILDTHRLMFCVLERGLKDIIKWHHPNHSKNASITEYNDSVSWLLGRGIYYKHESHIFSYATICETLGLPGDAIRNKLSKIMEGVDDVPEQLLGGSLWKYGITRSYPSSNKRYHIQESPLLLFSFKPIFEDEEDWHGYPERETIDSEDESQQEEIEDSWD